MNKKSMCLLFIAIDVFIAMALMCHRNPENHLHAIWPLAAIVQLYALYTKKDDTPKPPILSLK